MVELAAALGRAAGADGHTLIERTSASSTCSRQTPQMTTDVVTIDAANVALAVMLIAGVAPVSQPAVRELASA